MEQLVEFNSNRDGSAVQNASTWLARQGDKIEVTWRSLAFDQFGSVKAVVIGYQEAPKVGFMPAARAEPGFTAL